MGGKPCAPRSTKQEKPVTPTSTRAGKPPVAAKPKMHRDNWNYTRKWTWCTRNLNNNNTRRPPATSTEEA
jgi:hypothetical protein